MITTNIQLSFSKIFSILMLVVGTITTILLKDSSIMILTLTTTSVIITNKQYQDRKNKNKE